MRQAVDEVNQKTATVTGGVGNCYRGVTRPGSKPAKNQPNRIPGLLEARRRAKKSPVLAGLSFGGRYWARTSDPQLVELVLSQLS
jgi:hypothetical protein